MNKRFILFLAFSLLLTLPISAEEVAAPETKSAVPAQINTETAQPGVLVQQPQAAEPSRELAITEVAFTDFPKELSLAQDFTALITLPKAAELDKDSYSQKDFEILSANADQSGLNIEIKAVPFALGISTFTALTFTADDGSKFITKPVNAEVKPVDTGIKDEKLLDIRSPYRPFNYWLLIWPLLVIAAVIAAYIIYNKRRSSDKARILKAFQEDKRPLDIIALDRLDHLIAGDLWREGQYKFFYINMVDILRDYFSARFDIDAHKYTSKDLMRVLRKRSDFKADLRQLNELQRSADYVKFAKVEPTEAQREDDIRNMRNIIIDTRPPRLEPDSKNKTEQG